MEEKQEEQEGGGGKEEKDDKADKKARRSIKTPFPTTNAGGNNKLNRLALTTARRK